MILNAKRKRSYLSHPSERINYVTDLIIRDSQISALATTVEISFAKGTRRGSRYATGESVDRIERSSPS